MIDDVEAQDLPKRKKKLQPSWKNAPTRADLYNDYTSAESSQEDIRAKLSEYKLIRDGGEAITARPGKSTARPLLVRQHNEWKYPALEEPILSTTSLYKISGRTAQDVLAAGQNNSLLNYQWNTKIEKVNLVGNIIRTLVDEGTVIVKTGWESESQMEDVEVEVPVYASPEESIMRMQQAVQAGQMSPEQAQAMLETGEPMVIGSKIEMEEQEVLTKNQPAYEVCITANVTIDPTCEGIVKDAQFVIHEYDTSYAVLKEDEYDGEYGYYHNLDFINLEQDGNSETYDEYASDASNNFEFSDKARKRLRAYEYWGYWDIQGNGELTSIVATWVGTTLIRLEENPFPHGRLPFSVATYMPVKKETHGEPDAHLLHEQQDGVGKMTRAIYDITAKQAINQEFIDENFFPSPSQKNAYDKGNTVYYRSGFDPKKAIYRQDVQQVGSTPFDVIKWQETTAANMTGTMPFSSSKGAKEGGSPSDRNSMDATAKRELSILRRIGALLIDMARMTISMNAVFLDESEVVAVTDKEFVEIRREDLQGDFDLRVQVSTPEKDEDQATKIMKLMQTNAATMDQEIVKMHYVKLAELWGLEDLAENVGSYQPEPNPKQEKMLDLQLEEQQMKNDILRKQMDDIDSKITERITRADQNGQMDVELAQAKAQQHIATAEKLESEKDLLDIAALRIQTGLDRKESIEDQEYKAQVDSAASGQKADQDIALTYMDTSLSRMGAKQVTEI